ncbi:MAG: glycosyltransferase involved in cell wall biosynthesis [Parvicellaceae bacterium]|jgi:glycosyltransferase involved in cell wall biosynthesis
MKTILVTHPSNELYGADRILVNALKVFPASTRKIILLPKDGELTKFITDQVENTDIIFVDFLSVIYRNRMSVKGISSFYSDYQKTKHLIKNLHAIHNFSLAYHNTMAGVYVSKITDRLKIPSFLHCHEIVEKPKVVARQIAKMANRYNRKIVCVSKAVENNLHKYIRSGKTEVIYNGIQSIVAGQNIVKGPIRFFLIGRIKPGKGQWYLMDALKIIPSDKLKKARFHIVGDTVESKKYLRDDLLKRVIEDNLQSIVNILPFTPDVKGHFSKANVILVPSVMKDPFPTTVLEGMSCCRAVIATDHGGAKEIISNKKSGFLVKHNDARSLAKAIEYYLDYPEEIRTHGMRGKFIFNSKLTTSSFNERLGIFLNAHFGDEVLLQQGRIRAA